jgi:hypothetical protein
MHDAGEAYLGDMTHPLKHRSALGAAFRDAEARLEGAIRDRFKIKANVPEVKSVDRALLATERRAFAPRSGTGPNSRTSSRSTSSSPHGHRTRPPTSSPSDTPSSKPGAEQSTDRVTARSAWRARRGLPPGSLAWTCERPESARWGGA